MENSRLSARRSFALLALRGGDAIPLAEGALLIGAEESPGLDVAAYLSRIDALADEVREAVDNADGAHEAGMTLLRFLYGEQGFRGNPEHYYDPRNSFLHEVLDRRLGIPITLSILYMAVAERLGLRVEAIGLPGHFVLRLPESGAYLDPFTGQGNLTDADCTQRVRALFGESARVDRAMLGAQTNREILTRVLVNLREIYRTRKDSTRLLSVLDRLVVLNPGAINPLRDRIRVLSQQGEYRRALRDLERLAELQPGLRRSQRYRNRRRFVRDMAVRMN
ncbi:MAG: hypothetical protein QOF51_3681 [Chloroflexota bacterium]|nr:hypothetical protein [Chloroflexota bacterium]